MQQAVDPTGAQPPISPELPPRPAEQPEQPPAPDLSSVEADKIAIEQATQEEHVTTEGQVFKTLRAPAEVVAAPIPTETAVEQQEDQQVLKEVEKILQGGLVEINKKTGEMSGIFTDLPDDRKLVFKETGERIAKEFAANIKSGKIDGKDVYDEVLQWLKIIPNTNEPWRKQEATIKTDKILLLADALKYDSSMKS